MNYIQLTQPAHYAHGTVALHTMPDTPMQTGHHSINNAQLIGHYTEHYTDRNCLVKIHSAEYYSYTAHKTLHIECLGLLCIAMSYQRILCYNVLSGHCCREGGGGGGGVKHSLHRVLAQGVRRGATNCKQYATQIILWKARVCKYCEIGPKKFVGGRLPFYRPSLSPS